MTHLFPVMGDVAVPCYPQRGAFGTVRQHHTHEGVDLYVPEKTPVFAMELGHFVTIERFTGEDATPPSPWWNNTESILVCGRSGTILYGEIIVASWIRDILREGRSPVIERGAYLGNVLTVLRHDKGFPMSMLHLELYTQQTTASQAWDNDALFVPGPRPQGLLDPTELLLTAERW